MSLSIPRVRFVENANKILIPEPVIRKARGTIEECKVQYAPHEKQERPSTSLNNFKKRRSEL